MTSLLQNIKKQNLSKLFVENRLKNFTDMQFLESNLSLSLKKVETKSDALKQKSIN
jgi:hypothetical protein